MLVPQSRHERDRVAVPLCRCLSTTNHGTKIHAGTIHLITKDHWITCRYSEETFSSSLYSSGGTGIVCLPLDEDSDIAESKNSYQGATVKA